MTDLTKLTAEELLAKLNWYPAQAFAEIRRRLERLEKCEAALKRIATEHISYDDPAVAGQGQYSIGVTDGHRCAANVARSALEA